MSYNLTSSQKQVIKRILYDYYLKEGKIKSIQLDDFDGFVDSEYQELIKNDRIYGFSLKACGIGFIAVIDKHNELKYEIASDGKVYGPVHYKEPSLFSPESIKETFEEIIIIAIMLGIFMLIIGLYELALICAIVVGISIIIVHKADKKKNK